MAVGVQVPPSAPSNEEPHDWGFFIPFKKALDSRFFGDALGPAAQNLVNQS